MTAVPEADPQSLERRIIGAALELGFARAGIATPERSERAAERLASWLAAGHHGEMQYMAQGLDRSSPAALFEQVQSVVVVALPYADAAPTPLRRSATGPALSPLSGRVARYARGEDYHRVLRSKLEQLGAAIDALVGRPVGRRACVDSAPLLERDFAVRAGLGFAAKSTLTIVPGVGSFVLLGELLLDLPLSASADESAPLSGCGTCSRCLTACPTGAFSGPYVLDARRCISYLTIELKGAVPRELRALIGQHVFGCDICQDVCPWNQSRHAPPRAAELGERAELAAPDLTTLLFLSSSGYRKLVRGTALARVSRQRLARNAAIALGNSQLPAAEAPLARALGGHPSELVRAHAAWALGALGLPLGEGLLGLQQAAAHDASLEVRVEAQAALDEYASRRRALGA
jgi:epoxyqueuosine reductase